MDKLSQLYASGKYAEKNPDYHAKDSPFKWNNFQKCLKNASKNSKVELQCIQSVCEIGCGVGGILDSLKNSGIFPSLTKIEGWDINPSAIDIAKKKHVGIDFFCDDVFSSGKRYDLMLCADVFEHVENPFEFLRNLGDTSRHFLFNIPLEMNLLAMLRGRKFVDASYESVGHLHFYSASSAELILEICGYEILSKRFTRNRTGLLSTYPSLKNFVMAVPQFLLESFSPYLSSVLMGDSLVVLACRR
jgi:SAM-dependent methyltransferase